MVAAAVVGGIIGAKLWYVALTRDPGAHLLPRRAGLVRRVHRRGAGGDPQRLAAQGSAPLDHAARRRRRSRRPTRSGGSAASWSTTTTAGPSSLPWAMKFPRGLPAIDRRRTCSSSSAFRCRRAPIPAPCWRCIPPSSTRRRSCWASSWCSGGFGTSERPIGWLFGLYLVLAGRRALPDRDPPRQGRPLPGPLHHRPAHQRDPDRDRRGGADRAGPKGASPAPGAYLDDWQEGGVATIS